MYDIHMHLIPGVDDGCADAAMAAEMLRTAEEQGIRAIIATPHGSAFLWDRDRTLEQWDALRRLARELGSPIPLALGCEVLFTDCGAGMARNIDLLRAGVFPTLNGTDCVLTEFPPPAEQPLVETVCRGLLEAGYTPVVAHAERCPGAFGDTDWAEDLRREGALIQINAYSLAREHDPRILGTARALLARRLADFLGSDAHRTTHRPPKVQSGIRYIRETCDPAYAEVVLHGNAEERLGIGKKENG